jgi:hypothetical protein
MTNTVSSVTYYPGYSQQQISENLIWQVISSITQANPCVVTTVNTHNYPVGVNVSFLIPRAFGMQQINNVNTQIIAVTSNTMTLNLDSTRFSPFAYPSPLPNAYTPPTVFADSSGLPLPPTPLPYGNSDSFEGTIYNNGAIGDPINGA